MRTIDAAVAAAGVILIALALLAPGCAPGDAAARLTSPKERLTLPKDPHVDWIGSPHVARPTEHYLHDVYLVNIEIGLRSDGVVVWRGISGGE